MIYCLGSDEQPCEEEAANGVDDDTSTVPVDLTTIRMSSIFSTVSGDNAAVLSSGMISECNSSTISPNGGEEVRKRNIVRALFKYESEEANDLRFEVSV